MPGAAEPSLPELLAEIVAGSIGSLNVAMIEPAGSTFAAAATGTVEVIVGGVVSTGGVVLNTTSTQ